MSGLNHTLPGFYRPCTGCGDKYAPEELRGGRCEYCAPCEELATRENELTTSTKETRHG
jgi:hypothetical protein